MVNVQRFNFKSTPTDVDEVNTELASWLHIHKTNEVSVVVKREYMEPYIHIYTIETQRDFEYAAKFIRERRSAGDPVALEDRRKSRRVMGAIAEDILRHDHEHPYKRGLQWLAADAGDSALRRIDEYTFRMEVEFYNLVIHDLPDRYQDVFGMAIADMRRKHHRDIELGGNGFLDSEVSYTGPEAKKPASEASKTGYEDPRPRCTPIPDIESEDSFPEGDPRNLDFEEDDRDGTEDATNDKILAHYRELLMF